MTKITTQEINTNENNITIDTTNIPSGSHNIKARFIPRGNILRQSESTNKKLNITLETTTIQYTFNESNRRLLISLHDSMDNQITDEQTLQKIKLYLDETKRNPVSTLLTDEHKLEFTATSEMADGYYIEFEGYGRYAPSSITINTEQTTVKGNCNTTEEWGIVSDGEELLSDLPTVDESGVHSGTYRWVYWKKPVPITATLSVEGNMTDTNQYAICTLIGNSPSRYDNSSERLVGAKFIQLMKDTGNIELQYYETTSDDLILHDTIVIPSINSNFTLKVVPKTDSTDVYVDNAKYTTGALIAKNGDVPDSYYYRFRKWSSGEIIVHQIEYELPNTNA